MIGIIAESSRKMSNRELTTGDVFRIESPARMESIQNPTMNPTTPNTTKKVKLRNTIKALNCDF
jgi:hypothetical protein